MTLISGPSGHAAVSAQTIRVSGPPLTPAQSVIAVVCLVLVLWLAYRIGMVILRLVAGFLFIGFVCYGLWALFLR